MDIKDLFNLRLSIKKNNGDAVMLNYLNRVCGYLSANKYNVDDVEIHAGYMIIKLIKGDAVTIYKYL